VGREMESGEEKRQMNVICLVLLVAGRGKEKDRPIFCGGPIFGVATTAAFSMRRAVV